MNPSAKVDDTQVKGTESLQQELQNVFTDVTGDIKITIKKALVLVRPVKKSSVVPLQLLLSNYAFAYSQPIVCANKHTAQQKSKMTNKNRTRLILNYSPTMPYSCLSNAKLGAPENTKVKVKTINM